ncbi:prepilin peptidase [bacterium]|nr:prepilin peptidase [bacterium]
MSDVTVWDVFREPVVLGLFGLLVGSFLNVVIHRLPRGESLSSPGSHCPKCGKGVRPYDNVPVLSWLVLRGKCRDCRAPISARYPAVEAVTGALFALAGTLVTDPLTLAFVLLFGAAMVVVTLIDFDHMIIPDSITLPGIGLGLLAAFLGAAVDPKQALTGILVGGGGLFAVAAGYRAATGRDGLGGGDVKLLGMVGAFLGPVGAFLTIMIGSVAGTLFAVVFMLRSGKGRTAELPFGTFLAPGALVAMLFGPRIIASYWDLFS